MKQCLTFFTVTPKLNAFVILTGNTLTTIWIDEIGGDGVRLGNVFTHITICVGHMATILKVTNNLLCGCRRVRRRSDLLTILISKRHIEGVFTRCASYSLR